MLLKRKIAEKIEILKKDPKLFINILFNVTRTRLGLIPKSPIEGNRFSTEKEVKLLQYYAFNAKFGIVEIGILDGLTTKEMAKVANVPIYGIDPIIPDSMNKRLIGHEEKIKKNLSFYSKFYFFKDFSFNIVKKWDKKFDFIFIDGDHSYDAVKKDAEDWLPLLESGGFMCFHDSAPVTSIKTTFKGWPGPIQLVSELKEDVRVDFVENQDSINVFKKK